MEDQASLLVPCGTQATLHGLQTQIVCEERRRTLSLPLPPAPLRGARATEL